MLPYPHHRLHLVHPLLLQPTLLLMFVLVLVLVLVLVREGLPPGCTAAAGPTLACSGRAGAAAAAPHQPTLK
jgi:hypothetical protein